MMENDYVITRKGIQPRSEAEDTDIVRELSSRQELEEVIERMPYTQTIQAPNGKIRKEFYETALLSCEDLEWVRIIKSVYLRMEDRHYEEFEPEYLERAKAFLYGEIAAVFQIPFENVEQFLNETIEKQLNEF